MIDFTEFLTENGYIDIVYINDTHYAAIYRFMFTYAIIVGHIGDKTGYEDRWCFENYILAKYALEEWKSRGFDEEPIGWHRHPNTGRRRTSGDKNGEYINY